MEFLKEKDSRWGLIGTTLFHIILFILFIFLGLKTPVPIPTESILINFGTSNQGAGEVQPENFNPQQSNENTPTPVSNPQNTASSVNEIAMSDNTESVKINKKKQTEKVKEEIKEEPKVNEKALFPANKNKGGGSSGEGETGNPGDQGDPFGDRNAKNHIGNASGAGDNYSLGNRKALIKPKPNYDCKEQGKVVVEIFVDQQGNVVKVNSGIRGSTNTAPCLVSKAEEAARKTKWEPDINAPELQRGTITYNFELK
jgi:TonB family protein